MSLGRIGKAAVKMNNFEPTASGFVGKVAEEVIGKAVEGAVEGSGIGSAVEGAFKDATETITRGAGALVSPLKSPVTKDQREGQLQQTVKDIQDGDKK